MLFVPDEPEWEELARSAISGALFSALSKGWFQSSLVVNPNPGDWVSVQAASILCYPSSDSFVWSKAGNPARKFPFWWLQPWLAGLVLHGGRAISFADVSGQGNEAEEGCKGRLFPFQMDHPRWALEHQHPCRGILASHNHVII